MATEPTIRNNAPNNSKTNCKNKPTNPNPSTDTSASIAKPPKPASKRKRKRNNSTTTANPEQHQKTTAIAHPLHLYLALEPIPTHTHPRTTTAIDEPTLRLHLLTALTDYLGDHGAAIPIDILAVPSLSRPLSTANRHHHHTQGAADADDVNTEAGQRGDDEQTSEPGPDQIVVRVPWLDGAAVMAALASWAGPAGGGGVGGYVVRARSGWLAEVLGVRDVERLFEFGEGVDDGGGGGDTDMEVG